MHMVINLSNPPSGDNLFQMKEGEGGSERGNRDEERRKGNLFE